MGKSGKSYNQSISDYLDKSKFGKADTSASGRKTTNREKSSQHYRVDYTPENGDKYSQYDRNSQLRRDLFQSSPKASAKDPHLSSLAGRSIIEDNTFETQLTEYEYVPKFKGHLKRDEPLENTLIPISLQNMKSYAQQRAQGTQMID
jgi:hypothetical protein